MADLKRKTEMLNSRAEQGLPANMLSIGEMAGKPSIYLYTPKGSLTLRWDGKQLKTVEGKPLRLSQVVIDQVIEAIAAYRAPVIEVKTGLEVSRLTGAEREGWEWVAESGMQGEAARYSKTASQGTGPIEVYFSRDDLVQG